FFDGSMDDERRQKRKATPGGGHFPQHIAVVAAEIRGNQDRIAAGELPSMPRVDVGIQKRLVMQQVRRELRLAMFPEIVRTAADGVPDRRQLACDQRRILHAAYSYRHVESLSDQISMPIEKLHLHRK